MEALLFQWRRTQSRLYDQLREADLEDKEPFNVNGEHPLGDLWAWEEYAEANYREALPQYVSLTCLAVLLLPLMLK